MNTAVVVVALLGGPGPGVFGEASHVDAGGVVVEARLDYYGESRPLSGVNLHVTNKTSAPVDLDIDALELRSPSSSDAVAVDMLWFHDVTGGPYVEVRKNGVGPTRFAAPPSATIEVMLGFAPTKRMVDARRVTFRVNGAPAVVAGPVASISFSPDFVEGR